MIVDASAVVDALAETRRADAVLMQFDRARWLAAPHFIHVEVASALWRLARSGHLTDAASETAIQRLRELPLTAIDEAVLLRPAWSHRTSVRVSDAFYLAAAELTGAPLLTTDARLARGHHGVSIILVS